jgi:hypothetical protein
MQIFSNFWSSKPWIRIGTGSGWVLSLKCWIWIWIHIKCLRIRNTDFVANIPTIQHICLVPTWQPGELLSPEQQEKVSWNGWFS